MINNNKIVVTGGSGRFAQSLKKIKSKYDFIYPSAKSLNIVNLNSIRKFLKKSQLTQLDARINYINGRFNFKTK